MSRPSPIVTVAFNPAIDMTVGLECSERGRVNIGSSVVQQAGDKGVNVTAYLADWQAPVIAAGLLGDANAELSEALFTRKGVADSFRRVPGTNRTNIKISDQADGQTTDINLSSIDATLVDFGALCDRIDAFADIADTVLCGNLAGGLPSDTYVRLLTRPNRRGVPTLADTSGALLAQALAVSRDESPMAAKSNRHKLELWAGTSLLMLVEAVDVARAAHAWGTMQVIASPGEEGALFVTADGIWWASLPPVRAASIVGAGDAMVAGVSTGWHAGAGTEETVRLSVASAACELQRLGLRLPVPGEARERIVTVRMQRVA